MTQLSAAYSTPATRLVRWLVEPGAHAPREIHPQLIAGLFGTLVIFFGGVFNTIAVSSVAVFRHPTVPFVGWAAYEVLLGATRLVVLRHAHRAARQQQPTPTDAYVLLALCWAAGVGYGGYMGLASGDWLLACLTGISAAAMGGGIAFRNFYAPRLSAIMVALSFGPCGIAAALSSQHALWLLVPQVPVYIFGLCQAVYALNRMLVRTIAAERENDRRATHDQLTGLANRTGLERAIVEWQRQPGGPEALAFLYCDLDGFKAVNDRHGHAAGDALLRTVAERLRMAVPEGGLAARIGGDEFVLLIPDAERSRTHARAERVIVAIAERRYELDDDVSVAIGASIGVARSPEHGQDVATLMSAADAALYEAKARGRCRAVVARTPALRIAASGTALRRAGMR